MEINSETMATNDQGSTKLLAAASASSIDELVELFTNSRKKRSAVNSTTFDLVEVIGSLKQQDVVKLWNDLSKHTADSAIRCTMVSENGNLVSPALTDEVLTTFYLGVIQCAGISINQSDVTIPASLYQTVLLLHGFVIEMSGENGVVKNALAKLCENWWTLGLHGKENLMSSTVSILLQLLLKKHVVISDVKRMLRIKEALFIFTQCDNGVSNLPLCRSSAVWDLILNCFSHAPLLKLDKGRQLLAYIMAHSPGEITDIHSVIKYKLLRSDQVLVNGYADLYLLAWEISCENAEQQTAVENVIQDLMYSAIHMKRGNKQCLGSTLLKFLSHLHSHKLKPGVDDLLHRLYRPFLWRLLKSANVDVRANAATVFLDAFPIIDHSSRKDCDAILQQQFELFFELLYDDDHTVRQIAVTGVCRVMGIFWEQIPDKVSSDLLNTLLCELAWDQSSADIRVSVIKGLSELLDNYLTYSQLTNMLPTLADLFHDKVEKVRLAFTKLLLKIKHIKAFKVWRIVTREHVFARLEIESPAMCAKLVQLVYRSFINEDFDSETTLQKCIQLIEWGTEKARRFYTYAVSSMSVKLAVQYIVLLRKCLVICVNKEKANRENISPQLSTTLSTTLNATNQTLNQSANYTVVGDHIEEVKTDDDCDEDGEELSVSNTVIMRGMLDIVAIIWTGFSKELNKKGNEQISEELCSKWSKVLPTFFTVFEDEGIQQTLVYLSSLLPGAGITGFSSIALTRLETMDVENKAEISCLMIALCQWSHGKHILKLLNNWITLPSSQPRRRSNQLSFDGSKVHRGVKLLHILLDQPKCMTVLLNECRHLCVKLDEQMSCVYELCHSLLQKSSGSGCDIDQAMLQSIHTAQCKLYTALYVDDENKMEYFVRKITELVCESCVNYLSGNKTVIRSPDLLPTQSGKRARKLFDLNADTMLTSDESSIHNTTSLTEGASELASLLTESSLLALINVVVISDLESDSLAQIRELISSIIEKDEANSFDAMICELLQHVSKMVAVKSQELSSCQLCVQQFRKMIKSFIQNVLSQDVYPNTRLMKQPLISFFKSLALHESSTQMYAIDYLVKAVLPKLRKGCQSTVENPMLNMIVTALKACSSLLICISETIEASVGEPDFDCKAACLLLDLCSLEKTTTYQTIMAKITVEKETENETTVINTE